MSSAFFVGQPLPDDQENRRGRGGSPGPCEIHGAPASSRRTPSVQVSDAGCLLPPSVSPASLSWAPSPCPLFGLPHSGSHPSPLVCVCPSLHSFPATSILLFPLCLPPSSLPESSVSFSGVPLTAPLLCSSQPLVLFARPPLSIFLRPAARLPPPHSAGSPPFSPGLSHLYSSSLSLFFPVSFCVPPFLSVCLSIYHLPLLFLSGSVLSPSPTASGSPLWASFRPRSHLSWGSARQAAGSPLPLALGRCAAEVGGLPAAGRRAFSLPPSLTFPLPRGHSPLRPRCGPAGLPERGAAGAAGRGRRAPAPEVTLQRGGAGRGAVRAAALSTARSWGPTRDPAAAAAASRPPPTGWGLTWEPAAPRQPPGRAQGEQHTQVPTHGRRAHARCGPGRAGRGVRACGVRGPHRPAARRALLAAGSTATAWAPSLRAGAADELTATRSLARCRRGRGSPRDQPMDAGRQPAGGGAGAGVRGRPLPSGWAAGGG